MKEASMLIDILIALILIVVIGSTLFLARFISLNSRRNRELDRAGEDRVLRRVEQLMKDNHRIYSLVIDRQSTLDKKMNKFTNVLMDFNIFINLQLQKIETLIKSDMTAARRDELIRTKELKAALERLISITTLSRQPPIGSDILAIEAARNRIEELEKILIERKDNV